MNKNDLYIGQILIQTVGTASTLDRVIDIQSTYFTIKILKYLTNDYYYDIDIHNITYDYCYCYKEITALEKVKYL